MSATIEPTSSGGPVDVATALREREQELAQLVSLVPCHVWRLTAEGEPTFFNRRMVDFTGLDVADTNKSDMSRLSVMIESIIHSDDRRQFEEALRGCLASGEPFVTRYRLRRADGVYRWMSSRAEPMRDMNGSVLHWYGACSDVDDQVHTEEALRRSERHLHRLIDALPVHVISWTAAGEISFVSTRYREEVGPSHADDASFARAAQALVHPDDTEDVRRTAADCRQNGKAFAMRYRKRAQDGVYRWFDGRFEPLRDPDGTIVEWYGLSIDIDDLVRGQEALRKSERLFRQLVESLPAMIDCAAPDGEPIYRSQRLSEFLGYHLEELDGTGKSRLASTLDGGVHPDDVAGVKERYAHSLATGEPYMRRHRLRRFDGEYRWVETRAAAMRNVEGAIVQWSVICLDVDEEVRAQQELREREREFSQLVNMVPSLLWRLTPDGEPTFFNKRMIDFFGLDVGDYEQPGMTGLAAAITALTHPDDQAQVAKRLGHSLVTGERFTMRYRLRRADGVSRWVEGHGEPMLDDHGRILQWYGLVHDIDDQVHAEQALRQSAEQLRNLVDALPTHIWATSPEGEPSFLNRRLAEYVGLTLQDLDTLDASRLQMAIHSSVQPDDTPLVGRALAHSFATGETFAMKYRTRRADGAYRWVNTRAEPLRDPNGRIIQWYGVMFDIDDEVRAQDELRRTQERLAVASQVASLAELSASIAHEVNQPLAAVVANSHACHRWLSATPPNLDRAKVTAERIIRDANSAADVISRVRALFKPTAKARTVSSLGVLIAEVEELLSNDLRKRGVTLDMQIEPGVLPTAFDRVQVQQVLVNLMRNAAEAMESISGPRVLTVRARQGTDAVTVEVSDSGVGLEAADRIFEPFFTTKESGMGMGLAICRSIVESHGGQLWAEKREPQGAAFLFTLPRAEKSAE
jgi:PAS domain S-box-containing protein